MGMKSQWTTLVIVIVMFSLIFINIPLASADSIGPVMDFVSPLNTSPLTGVEQGSTLEVTVHVTDVDGVTSMFFQAFASPSASGFPTSGPVTFTPSTDVMATFSFGIPLETSIDTIITINLFAQDSGFNNSGPETLTVTVVAPQVAIGGTILPIDTTALLVAGAQTMTPWLILGVLSAVGVGFAVFTLKRSR